MKQKMVEDDKKSHYFGTCLCCGGQMRLDIYSSGLIAYWCDMAIKPLGPSCKFKGSTTPCPSECLIKSNLEIAPKREFIIKSIKAHIVESIEKMGSAYVKPFQEILDVLPLTEFNYEFLKVGEGNDPFNDMVARITHLSEESTR